MRLRREQIFRRTNHRHSEIVEGWADKWRTLKAWGKPLTCGLRVLGRHEDNRMGDCSVDGKLVRIYDSGYIHEDLATVLHEMAHVVTNGWADVAGPDGHGRPWRTFYGAALAEVTGEDVPEWWFDKNREIVDGWADQMVCRWWRKNGYDLALKLGSGLIHANRAYYKSLHAYRKPSVIVDIWGFGLRLEP